MAEIKWKTKEEIEKEQREKELIYQISDLTERIKSLENTILLLMKE